MAKMSEIEYMDVALDLIQKRYNYSSLERLDEEFYIEKLAKSMKRSRQDRPDHFKKNILYSDTKFIPLMENKDE